MPRGSCTLLFLVALAACSSTSSEPSNSGEPPPLPKTEDPVVHGAAVPASHELPPDGASSQQVGHLTFDLQEGWVAEIPKSAMRKAQYRLPGDGEGEDAGDAELVIFHFGAGGGGGVDANIDRWIGQFEQPDGTPSADRAERRTIEVNGMTVHLLDIAGSYVARAQPGQGEPQNLPDHRMLAAIIETDQGSYFLKLLGPDGTVAANAERFETYVVSARP